MYVLKNVQGVFVMLDTNFKMDFVWGRSWLEQNWFEGRTFRKFAEEQNGSNPH